MAASGFYILLLFAMSCCAAPNPEKDLKSCRKPDRWVEAELLGDWEDESYPENTEAVFQCRPGYTLLGSIKMICKSGKWQTYTKGQCKKKFCGHPGDIPFGSFQLFNEESFIFGAVVEYFCDDGYQMVSKETRRQCTASGWSNYPPHCEVIQCSVPVIDHGSVQNSRKQVYSNNEVMQFTCETGFQANKNGQSTCTKDDWIPKPSCEESAKQCGPPPTVQFADTVEIRKSSYNSGEFVKYRCPEYYTLEGTVVVRCLNGVWDEAPACREPCITNEKDMEENNIQQHWIFARKIHINHGDMTEFTCKAGYETSPDTQMRIACQQGKLEYPKCIKRGTGAQCGPPPTVQYGDTLDIRKANYKSGEKVEFRCPKYYILEGNRFVTCFNGVWSSAPVCLVPCTAKERDMESNNIQLKWTSDRKFYSRHGETIEFICKPGYEAPPDPQMRITCDQGNLEYPKCFKRGFCVLQQSSMIANNMHYNLSTVVDHGETILFQCNEGMVSENKLEAKCELGKINYPRCTAADICKTPEIQNGFLKIEQQASYNSGSYVEFECNEGYVIDVAMKVKCENGQWSKLPVCYSPCKISPEDLTKHNIQLLSSNDQKTIPDKNYKHGTEISVACKSGFRRPTFIDLVLECYDGKFRYPRCFSGRTCRIVQDDLDENNLELDEVHDNEVFYAEGEVIQYKCKNGFEYRGRPTGICSEQALSYPKCTESSKRLE